MYIHMNMAKTIMISNDVYEELKMKKGSKSFSETIKEALDRNKIKTGKDLLPFVGILEGDIEYDEIMKKMKPKWKEWTDKVYGKSA